VEDEAIAADAAIPEVRIMQRNIDRELARLDAQRTADPPKMGVRIDLNSEAATSATLLVSYAVRGALVADLRCAARHRRARPQAVH
jgi:hypothetical protein